MRTNLSFLGELDDSLKVSSIALEIRQVLPAPEKTRFEKVRGNDSS
jgi:hypothetical protein